MTIFNRPLSEYLGHIAAHVFVGTTVGSLVPWLVGSLILAATRKLSEPCAQV